MPAIFLPPTHKGWSEGRKRWGINNHTSPFTSGRGGSETRPYSGQAQGAGPSATKGPGAHSIPWAIYWVATEL